MPDDPFTPKGKDESQGESCTSVRAARSCLGGHKAQLPVQQSPVFSEHSMGQPGFEAVEHWNVEQARQWNNERV